MKTIDIGIDTKRGKHKRDIVDMEKEKINLRVHTHYNIRTNDKEVQATFVDINGEKIRDLFYRNVSMIDALGLSLRPKDRLTTNDIIMLIGDISTLSTVEIADKLKTVILKTCQKIDKLLNNPDHDNSVDLEIDVTRH